ncbi:MAG TPA: redoxin family protein [Alphaproteobacteria bacterium]|jgi:peroxiredoxin|nr:redoxin family protein [Alphaproteobacteria bacterium]
MKTFIMAALAMLALTVPAMADHHGEAVGDKMMPEMSAPETDNSEISTVAEVGKPAPEFMLDDVNGEHVMLSALKGKTVVLEWTNHECPYVKKHYDSGNMQKLQKEATDDGVVWISIVSSSEGKEGFTTPEEAKAIMAEQAAHPSNKLLDTNGVIGHLYGAKTTPHMFVIDKDGVLVYAGAIDDNNSYKPESLEGAKNYVREALAALKEGKPVENATTQSYGCGVKY